MKKLTLLSCLFILTACGQKQSCKELFDEHLEVNVKACMGPMKSSGIDSTEARIRCTAIMYKLYELDSTFVRKSAKELDEFFKANRAPIESID